jgi:hypothetical protein
VSTAGAQPGGQLPPSRSWWRRRDEAYVAKKRPFEAAAAAVEEDRGVDGDGAAAPGEGSEASDAMPPPPPARRSWFGRSDSTHLAGAAQAVPPRCLPYPLRLSPSLRSRFSSISTTRFDFG